MSTWPRILLALTLLLGAPFGCAEEDPGTVGQESGSGEESGDEDFEAVFDVTSLFDMADITDAGKLNLELKKDVVQLHDGGLAWMVPFAYRSGYFLSPWDHPSVLYVPLEMNPERAGTIAIIQQGTDDLEPGLNVDEEFGLKTALELGVPVAVVGKLPHSTYFSPIQSLFGIADEFPQCFETPLVGSLLMWCSDQISVKSMNNKFSWSVHLALARAWMRSITALTEIPGRLEEFEDKPVPAFTVERVVMGGAASRAEALWLAAAIDDRIDGLWIVASDRVNWRDFYHRMQESWGAWLPEDPAEKLLLIDSDFGVIWRSLRDPLGFMDLVSDREIAIVRGTHDGLAPVGSIQGYLSELPADATYQLIPAVGHAMATPAHVASWRAFVRRVSDDEPSARPQATFALNDDVVEVEVRMAANVTVDSSEAVVHLTDVHAVEDDRDLRDAVWSAFPLLAQGVNGEGMRVWTGSFSPQPIHWAAFVEVSGFGATVTTSPHLSWESAD